MRDPNRIPQILSLLEKGWKQVPDWRFCQIFENIKRYSGKDDLFYMEDNEFIQLLTDYFDLDEKTMKSYYIIVPRDDGYTYLTVDSNGKYKLLSKTVRLDASLMFEDKIAAECYIKSHFDKKHYIAQEISLNKDYYKKIKDNNIKNNT